jgi:hypothetical protein
MNNSPLSSESIGRSQAFFPAREPFDITAGDQIAVTIRVRFDPQIIAWTIKPPHGAPIQKLSTWASTLLTDYDLSSEPAGAASLNKIGYARQALLGLVDGKNSAQEIENALFKIRPCLFPTEAQLRKFVADELARNTRV